MVRYAIVIAACFLNILGCSTSRSFQIECQSVSADASYVVDITTQSKNELSDLHAIKLEAIDGILFRGITGPTCVSQKPMLTQPRPEVRNNQLIRSIYGKGNGCDKYITGILKLSSSTNQDLKKPVNVYKYRVTVNRDLLRKDLTEAGLLKSLNSGF